MAVLSFPHRAIFLLESSGVTLRMEQGTRRIPDLLYFAEEHLFSCFGMLGIELDLNIFCFPVSVTLGLNSADYG